MASEIVQEELTVDKNPKSFEIINKTAKEIVPNKGKVQDECCSRSNNLTLSILIMACARQTRTVR